MTHPRRSILFLADVLELANTSNPCVSSMVPVLVGIVRHFKKLGKEASILVNIYCTFIRPIFDYACASFHTTLTGEQSESLERLQCLTLKTIFGFDTSYSKCLELAGIERLDLRRENLF